MAFAQELARKHGTPDDVAELEQMAPDEAVLAVFRKVVEK